MLQITWMTKSVSNKYTSIKKTDLSLHYLTVGIDNTFVKGMTSSLSKANLV